MKYIPKSFLYCKQGSKSLNDTFYFSCDVCLIYFKWNIKCICSITWSNNCHIANSKSHLSWRKSQVWNFSLSFPTNHDKILEVISRPTNVLFHWLIGDPFHICYSKLLNLSACHSVNFVPWLPKYTRTTTDLKSMWKSYLIMKEIGEV